MSKLSTYPQSHDVDFHSTRFLFKRATRPRARQPGLTRLCRFVFSLYTGILSLSFSGVREHTASNNTQTVVASKVLQAITELILNQPATKNKQRFLFFNTEEAKSHNAKILRSFDFNISRAIKAQPNTLLSFGSEFRQPDELEPLLAKHPLWADFKQTLLHGASFPL